MTANKNIEVKKTETELAQEFLNKYKKLCDEYGFRIVVNPAWVARDDGSWSLVLQTSVGELPKRKI